MSFKGWFEKTKEKVSDKAKEVKNDAAKFYYDNETFIKAVAIPTAVVATRQIVKTHKKHTDKHTFECDHYDPRLGIHFTSRRPLSNSEKISLQRLYERGYSKGEALKILGLLR